MKRVYEYTIKRNFKLCLNDANMTGPANVTEFAAQLGLHHEDNEKMLAVMLNTGHKIIGYYVVATGTVAAVKIDVRTVFRQAIFCNAKCLLLIHNHPSGVVDPSYNDVSTTEFLVKSGDLLEIPIIDHVIIAQCPHTGQILSSSMRELNLVTF